jgi:V/A-type H+-transporting ATPase subunit D
MLINVNATRMELLRIRKRLNIALRGHKLLKDKRDELLRQLLSMIEEVKSLRIEIEKEFQSILEGFMLAKAKMGPFQIEQSLISPMKEIRVLIEEKNVVSVRVPIFKKEIIGEILPYGFLNTSGETDVSLIKFEKFLESLFILAEKEKAVLLISHQIEETRRRVNALEYKLIPDLQETIKYISMKLEESDRASTVRLMKIKDIVRKH